MAGTAWPKPEREVRFRFVAPGFSPACADLKVGATGYQAEPLASLNLRGVKVIRLDRSRIIHFAEAQAGLPTGERSARVWQRGSLDVAFALAVPPKDQAPHTQNEILHDHPRARSAYS